MVNSGRFYVLQIVWIYLQRVISFPASIPVGAIFEKNPPSVFQHTAFQYGILKHNFTYIFNLAPNSKFVQPDDNLNFTTTLCDTMQEGVMLIYGTQTADNFDVISSYSRTFNIPYVTIGPVLRSSSIQSSQYIIHLEPDYLRAIVDIIIFYKWSRLHYMYNTKEGLLRLEMLTNLLLESDWLDKVYLDVYYVYNTDDVYQVLRTLDSADPDLKHPRNIIVDMPSRGATMSILRQVKEMGMNRDKYHYVIAGYDIDSLTFDGFHHSGVKITGFRLADPLSGRVRKFLIQWQHLDTKSWPGAGTIRIRHDIALAFDATQVIGRALDNIRTRDSDTFKKTFRRGKVYNNGTQGVPCVEPVIPWKHGNDIRKALASVRFKGLTGRISFDENGFRKDYSIDILGLKKRQGLTKVGVWTDKSRLSINNTYISLNGKKANRPRRVSSIESEPFLMVKKSPEDDGKPLVGNDRYEGYCVDLAQQVAEAAGFSYKIHIVKDGKFGSYTNFNSSYKFWNGMIGELVNDKADLVIAPLTISSTRQRFVAFSKPYMNLGISIMIKRPEKQKPGVFSFFDPLASNVWALVTVAGVTVSVVLFGISRVSPYEWDIAKDEYGAYASNEFGIANSFWFALGTFMQQGGDTSPRSFSGRIVTSVWSLFTLILISSYTANLAAFLTIERMFTPINSVTELEAQRDIQYGTLKSGSTEDFFKNSKIHVYKRMHNYMENTQPSVYVETTAEGVQRVRDSKSKYAFLLESTMNSYMNERKPCTTIKVGDNLDSKGYGIATQINSALEGKVNLAVLKLREQEILSKLQKKWWYDKSECILEGKDSKQRPLGLSNVAGIFYILIGGLGLAMAISLIEFIYKSRAESKKKQYSYAATTAPHITYDAIDGSHTEV